VRPAAGGGEGWEVLELIGAYAAGELEGEQARLAERLIIERPGYYGRLAESYARMLVLLSSMGEEELEAPEAMVNYAVRRAYLSALLRQAEQVVRGLAGDYVGALIFYLGLRSAPQE
jgi:hypothetical protein